MKKALLLAMMLVLALSVAVSAEDKYYPPSTPLEPNDLFEGMRSFDVNINIHKFAYIAELSTETMVFELETPAAMGETYSIRRPFIFGTNTPVKVSLPETFTNSLPETSSLATAVALWKFSGATKINDVVGKPGSNSASASYTFTNGRHEGLLVVAVGWYNTDKISQAAGNWDDKPWWEALAGEYGGYVEVTIEPLEG